MNSSNNMRALIQRVSEARVTVAGEVTGQIGQGMLVLLGVGHEDSANQVAWMAEKLTGLRIFEDDEGKMNLSLTEVGGAMLVVSQFTLFGECKKGKRPSFTGAAPPEQAQGLYNQFVDAIRQRRIEVGTGRFREHMDVALVNDGPVTLWVESP